MSESSYERRVAIADDAYRHFNAQVEGLLPLWQLDQVDAAVRDTWAAARDDGIVGAPCTDPDVLKYLFGGLLGCEPCPHLATNPQQPAMASLTSKRIYCEECANAAGTALRRADECGLCETQGHERLTDLFAVIAHVQVSGVVCDTCVDRLSPILQ